MKEYKDDKRRFTCDPGGELLMCNFCKHRIGKTLKCTAFPNGIPVELLRRGEHNTPYPGDNGYRFEPIDK